MYPNKRGRTILARREQNWRKKPTEQPKDYYHLRVECYCEKKRNDGNARHQRESRRERNQIVERVGGENTRVKDQNAGGAQTLSGHAIILPGRAPSGRDQSQANQGPDHNPHTRRDQIVLERILHEKNDAEEKDEATDPREKFHSHERFPINGRSNRQRWWRDRLVRGGGEIGSGGGTLPGTSGGVGGAAGWQRRPVPESVEELVRVLLRAANILPAPGLPELSDAQ